MQPITTARSRRLLCLLFACTVMQAGASQAQDERTAAEDGLAVSINLEDLLAQGDEMSGFAARQKANLDLKRYNEGVVDGISAEGIGQFPDKNIADSLQRVTGVSITRDFGEGEKISIRGTAPGLNRTLLNGQHIATADWFILDSPSRAFNYSLLASEMVSSLEVHKTPRADMDEGSIGGTVVLRTRKPLFMAPNTTVASIQGAYSDLSDEWDPQLSALHSWHNEARTFGVLVSGVRQDRTLRRDGFEILGYEGLNFEGEDILSPALIGSTMFEQKRERTGSLLTLQFRPEDRLDITFNALRSRMNADNTNHNLLTVPTWEFNPDRNPGGPEITSHHIRNGTLLAMDFGSKDRPGAVHNIANRRSFAETESYDLDMTFEELDWSAHAQMGFTRAKGGTQRDIFTEFSANTRQSFDLRHGVPEVSFPDIDHTDPATFSSLDWVHMNGKPQEEEERYFQFDFQRLVDWYALTSVKSGIKYRDSTKSQSFSAGRFHVPTDGFDDSVMGEIQASGITMADYSSQNLSSDFMAGERRAGSLTGYPLLNTGAWNKLLLADPDRVVFFEHLPDFFEVNEKITAGYLMANFENGPWIGNFGARVIYTDVTSKAWTWNGPWWDPENQAIRREGGSYTDVLPSFNVTYELSDDMLIRGSAAKVMARPDYQELSSSQNINPNTNTGVRGNPTLDPFRANQFDLSWEWYFDRSSLVSAAIFYKDIDSYTQQETRAEALFNELSGEVEEFQISTPVNGKGGTNRGLELSYQQGLFNGLGVIFNYTFSDAETDDGGLIPGNSKHTYNATGYYQGPRLGARLSYNYRTKYFEGLDRGSELMTDSLGQLDASAFWQVNDTFSMILQAVNLTDETITKFSGSRDRPYAYYKNGRRFFVGAQLKF